MRLSCKSTIFLLVLSIAAAAASAETIDFSNLPTTGGPPFLTDTQGNFTVTTIGGQLTVGDVFGDPVPDIFTSNGGGTIQVKRNDGGNFDFSSVDLATSGAGTYSILGLLNGVQEFTASGPITGHLVFNNYNPGDNSDIVNALDIAITNIGAESDLDNIVVDVAPPPPVPEPSSLLLMATGVLGAAGAVRRRICA